MILSDDDGQIAIDFLFGLSFFLIALMFTIQFIPALFTSASYSQEELGFVSYRTGSILAEDPGWWSNGSHAGSDWELHPDSTIRIGLAEDSNTLSQLTDSPNILNRTKIIRMREFPEGDLISLLGLFENINGARVNYSYNITLSKDGEALTIRDQAIRFGKEIPTDMDILQTRRIVMVAPVIAANFTASQLTGTSGNNAILNVAGPLEDDVIIQITGFDATSPEFVSVDLEGSHLQYSTNYTVYKKVGNTDYVLYSPPVTLNSTDIFRIAVNRELFDANHIYELELGFNNTTFPVSSSYIEYTNYTSPIYETADMVVNIWK
jgi:hypothetical protein